MISFTHSVDCEGSFCNIIFRYFQVLFVMEAKNDHQWICNRILIRSSLLVYLQFTISRSKKFFKLVTIFLSYESKWEDKRFTNDGCGIIVSSKEDQKTFEWVFNSSFQLNFMDVHKNNGKI